MEMWRRKSLLPGPITELGWWRIWLQSMAADHDRIPLANVSGVIDF
jgi:hypothetical protein